MGMLGFDDRRAGLLLGITVRGEASKKFTGPGHRSKAV